jgi:hypothetical protein
MTVRVAGPDSAGPAATIVTDNVRAEQGTPDGLHYILARAVEGMPVAVTFDPGGFVGEVKDWDGLREAVAARIPSLTDTATVTMIDGLLKLLDAGRSGGLIDRPFLLMSAIHNLPYRADLAAADFPDWQGGSAFIFPGRRISPQLLGRQGETVFGKWSIRTDPALAGRNLAAEVLPMLAAVAAADPSVADATRYASTLLTTQGLNLTEEGIFAYDVGKRRVTRFQHRLGIAVGEFRKDALLTVELAE